MMVHRDSNEDSPLVFGDPSKGQNPNVTYLDTKGKGFIEVTFSGNDYSTRLHQKDKLSGREMEDAWVLAKVESRSQVDLLTHPEDLDKMEKPFPIDGRATIRRLFEQGYVEIVN